MLRLFSVWCNHLTLGSDSSLASGIMKGDHSDQTILHHAKFFFFSLRLKSALAPVSHSAVFSYSDSIIYPSSRHGMSFSTEIPSFIKKLYRNILDRDLEDQASIEYWTNHVRFHGISSTISMLFSSNEIKNLPPDVIVDKLYSSILGREGEWDGKNYFIRRLTRGDAMHTIVDDFVGSTEYKQQKAQTGTDMSV